MILKYLHLFLNKYFLILIKVFIFLRSDLSTGVGLIFLLIADDSFVLE